MLMGSQTDRKTVRQKDRCKNRQTDRNIQKDWKNEKDRLKKEKVTRQRLRIWKRGKNKERKIQKERARETKFNEKERLTKAKDCIWCDESYKIRL